MPIKNEEYIFFAKASRKLDKRTIYLKITTIVIDRWVDLGDTLVDCEFKIKKITKDEYYIAFDKCLWVYTLNDDNINRFKEFISLNYVRTKEKLGPKLLPPRIK